MIKMIWKTLAVDKMDIEKTADLKCISRFLVEKWHVDQIKMKITVSPIAIGDARETRARARKGRVVWRLSPPQPSSVGVSVRD